MAVPGVRHPQQGEVAKGDWIWLVSRFGTNGETIKRTKARVVDVMRKAMVLDNIEGRKPGTATVHFNELEVMPPELQPEGSPSRKKWERRNLGSKPEPLAQPSLKQSPFAGKFDEPSVVDKAMEILSKIPPATPPQSAAPSPPRPRSAPPPAARPANGAGQRSNKITTDDDEWAAQGREVLRKKVVALEERRATAAEEMEALKTLMDGIERELDKSRAMLSMLDENYGAAR